MHIGLRDGFRRREEVEHLPADHAPGSDTPRHLGGGAHNAVRRHPRHVGVAGQQLEGERVQRIAGQHRDRLAVNDMTRGPAPPGRRIVHGGKIVMDEGVGMNQLDRARSGQDRLCRHPRHLRPGEHEDGPQPLAAGKHAVAHRLQHSGR